MTWPFTAIAQSGMQCIYCGAVDPDSEDGCKNTGGRHTLMSYQDKQGQGQGDGPGPGEDNYKDDTNDPSDKSQLKSSAKSPRWLSAWSQTNGRLTPRGRIHAVNPDDPDRTACNRSHAGIIEPNMSFGGEIVGHDHPFACRDCVSKLRQKTAWVPPEVRRRPRYRGDYEQEFGQNHPEGAARVHFTRDHHIEEQDLPEGEVRRSARDGSPYHAYYEAWWDLHNRLHEQGGQDHVHHDDSWPWVPHEARSTFKVSHGLDQNDETKIRHCPSCGAGDVWGGSSGDVHCDSCGMTFTVQAQPEYPQMPQNLQGMPLDINGDMDPSAMAEDPEGDGEGGGGPPWAEGGDEGDENEEGDEEGSPADEEDQGKNGSSFPPKKSFYMTHQGNVVDKDNLINYLAIRHAPNPQTMIRAVKDYNTAE